MTMQSLNMLGVGIQLRSCVLLDDVNPARLAYRSVPEIAETLKPGSFPRTTVPALHSQRAPFGSKPGGPLSGQEPPQQQQDSPPWP